MLRATIPCLSYRISVGVKSQGVKGSIELEGTSKIPGIFSGKGLRCAGLRLIRLRFEGRTKEG